jgi:transcriptional regulator with XRE-family HTH domain
MWKKDFSALKADLSKNIKSIRLERGTSQEKLGFESGVDRTLVSKIERQIANPSLEILTKIAAQLQVSVIDLLKAKE